MVLEKALDGIVDTHAEAYPDAEACRDATRMGETRAFSYRDLRSESEKVASALRRKLESLREADDCLKPVGICMERGFKWYCVYIACVRLGVPVAPMVQDIDDTSASMLRNEKIIKELTPLLVIVDETTPSPVLDLLRCQPVVFVSELESFVGEELSYSEKSSSRDLTNTPLAYAYTGGTTRASKCVKISHQMAMHEMAGYPAIAKIRVGDSVLQHSSTYWGATFLGQINIALAFGASVVFANNETDLTSVIEREKISVLGLVPSQLEAITGLCKTVHTIFTWGEKLSKRTGIKWKEKVRLVELLVSTEYWLCLYALNGEENFRILNTPGVDIRSEPVRGDGSSSFNGSELLIGGDCVTRFGYTDESLNERCFSYLDGKRFFKSNDLVEISYSNSRVKFLGRSDSMIKIGGEWKDLFLIQETVKNVAGVADCCVFENIVNVVLTDSFTEHSLNECRALVNEQYLQLQFLSSLPRNPVTGKVDRTKLKYTATCANKDIRVMSQKRERERRILKTFLFWIVALIGSVWVVGITGILIAPFVALFLFHFDLPSFPYYKQILRTCPAGIVVFSLTLTFALPTVVSLLLGISGFFLYLKRHSLSLKDKICFAMSWPVAFWAGLPRQVQREDFSSYLFFKKRKYFQQQHRMEMRSDERVCRKFEIPRRSYQDAKNRETALKTFPHTEISFSESEMNEFAKNCVSEETAGAESFSLQEEGEESEFKNILAEIVANACPSIPCLVNNASLSSINSLSAVEIANHVRDETEKDIRVSDVLKCVRFSDLVRSVQTAPFIDRSGSSSSSSSSLTSAGTEFRCQLWGWGFPCTWVFQHTNKSDKSIHFRSLVFALKQLAVRHPALLAIPTDPSPVSNWMNETLVVVGLLQHVFPKSCVVKSIGRALFNCWNRGSVRKNKDIRVAWKGLTFYSETDFRQYLLSKKRHPNFTPPIEVDLITLNSASGPSREFVRMYLTHAFSDGSCVIPLLKELNELYSASVENRQPQLSPHPPPSGLFIQEQRLFNTLTARLDRPDIFYACYNMDMCENPENSSFGRIVLLHESFILIAQAAAKRMSVPIDVLLLSAIVCALARLWHIRSLVEMALVVPLRDGPHEADVIGFLADQRNLDVPIESEFATIASVVQTIHFLRRTRAWKIPQPFSNCQRTLVNIVQASFPENAPFKQELLLQQHEHSTGVLFRPMELYVEQVDSYTWTMKARCRMREYSAEKFQNFCDLFKKVVTDLLVNPNLPLHTSSS